MKEVTFCYILFDFSYLFIQKKIVNYNNPVLYAKLTAVYMQFMHFMQCIHLFYYKQFIFKLLLITFNLQLQTFFRCIYIIYIYIYMKS